MTAPGPSLVIVGAARPEASRAWYEALPFRGAVAMPEQRHTPHVVEASRPGWYAGVDGLWSRGATLGVRTADCAPLELADRGGAARALVHAGRAGIGAGIVEAAVAAMVEGGVPTASMVAAVGPHIRACCYRFPLRSPAAQTVARQLPFGTVARENVWAVDLAKEITVRLAGLGVNPPRVDPRCTCCHPTRLPSHRREGEARRRSLLRVSMPLRKEPFMSVDPELISILACPETKEPVALASDELVGALNELIEKGHVKNRGGQPVTERMDGGLIREDRRFLYPIRDDIPIMLIEEAIELPPLGL